MPHSVVSDLGLHCLPLYHKKDTRLRSNKKIPVFRVARPYLNILMKPRMYFQVFWKNIILCILKGISPFKMHKIIFLFQKRKLKKKRKRCMRLPYLKFSEPLP